MVKRHKLPVATVIDGRSLYTAGDMRAYYDLALIPNETIDPIVSESKPDSSMNVDDLMKMFGMTK